MSKLVDLSKLGNTNIGDTNLAVLIPIFVEMQLLRQSTQSARQIASTLRLPGPSLFQSLSEKLQLGQNLSVRDCGLLVLAAYTEPAKDLFTMPVSKEGSTP